LHDLIGHAGERPTYALNASGTRWATIIEVSFAVENAPWIAEVANQLSRELRTYCLCMVLHDDDVFLYNLDHCGESLDGYNSNPQYFEEAALSREEIEDQRHSPDAFAPLLPAATSVDELRALLHAGWWTAYDAGRLDSDGVPVDDEWPFDTEGERMTRFGTLLGLAGESLSYPFTAWAEATQVPWQDFTAVQYSVRAV